MTPRTPLLAIGAAGLAALAVVAVLYGMGGETVHASDTPPAVLDKLKMAEGRPAAPEFGFIDAEDKPLKLADYRGRYVLVNLWATWCGPCITELPDLAELQKLLPQDQISVVPVDVLERLDAAKLGEFLAMHEVEGLPIYMDRDRETQRALKANELPLTVLIDAEGREVARAAGAQKWADPQSVAYLKAISTPSPAK